MANPNSLMKKTLVPLRGGIRDGWKYGWRYETVCSSKVLTGKVYKYGGTKFHAWRFPKIKRKLSKYCHIWLKMHVKIRTFFSSVLPVVAADQRAWWDMRKWPPADKYPLFSGNMFSSLASYHFWSFEVRFMQTSQRIQVMPKLLCICHKCPVCITLWLDQTMSSSFSFA